MGKKVFDNEKKEWYKSKTVWINVLAIAGGILTALSGELNAGATLSVFSVLNLILRVVSKHQLTK